MQTLQFIQTSNGVEKVLSIEPIDPVEMTDEISFKVKLVSQDTSEQSANVFDHSMLLDTTAYAEFIEIMKSGCHDDYYIPAMRDSDDIWLTVVNCECCNRREIHATMQYVDESGVTHSLMFTFEPGVLAKFNLVAEPHYVEAVLKN